MRDPRAAGDKRLCCADLSLIISDDEPDEDICINGSHDGV